MHEKFKSWLSDDTLYGAVLIFLVGIGSFGLGRLSVMTVGAPNAASDSRVILLATSTKLIPATSTFSSVGATAVAPSPPSQHSVSGPYVGSKSGTKYYLVSCSGVKRIKETNKVFFATKDEAAAAGYAPAANCPGL